MLPLPHAPERLAWPRRTAVGDDIALLDALTTSGPWNGPLIVAMPRTGSTLLGTLFLLARQPHSGRPVFTRYIHEPVAPVYWSDRSLASVLDLTGGRLTSRDIVQESAYQFTARSVARWFLQRARQPIAFTMRHPRLAWPSRWRLMLREWLHADPDQPDARRFRAALDSDDFSDLGDVLTTRVRQPDNGWYAFMSLLHLCEEDGIDFVLVDNQRFRADPEAMLRALCRRWGIAFDAAMIEWDDLSEALPRVVMSELARSEYPWYYAGTLESTEGIRTTDSEPLPGDRFPEVLRGTPGTHLTIDHAEDWYDVLRERDEML